jgi:hypothetical protein
VVEKSNRTDLIGLEKSWFKHLLGFTESAIILEASTCCLHSLSPFNLNISLADRQIFHWRALPLPNTPARVLAN